MMKPKIRLKVSDVKVVPQEILSRYQEDLEKIKRQKREWYHRNKKKVLKQQKTSERKKEYLKEWYLKNKQKRSRSPLNGLKRTQRKDGSIYRDMSRRTLQKPDSGNPTIFLQMQRWSG